MPPTVPSAPSVAPPAGDGAARVARARRAARRALRRHRRTLGAVLVAAAVLVLLGQVRPPPPPTAPVVVAARDLAAASVLTREDVTVVQVPIDVATATAPSSFSQPDAVVGEVLAAPVATGEALSSVRLRGASLLTGQAEGSVALPVRLGDAGAAVLLSPGDRIDLVAARSDGEVSRGVVVAEHLPVLLVPGGGTGTATGLGALTSGSEAGPGVDADGGLVVVAALPDEARAVVAAGADGPLWFTLAP